MTNKTRVAAIAAVVGSVVMAATSASAALNLPTQSCSYTFNTNLRLGSRSESVRDLQKVLNMYPQTQVAASGVGSMGMETNYFGPATRRAVVKFQELHAADTLAPIGATVGTGNVFSLTRAVLNQICNGTTSGNTGTSTNTTSGNVQVSLASSQPNSILITSQTGARIGDFNFTGNGSVTSVTLMRTGASNNDTLTNVYLYDGAVRLTDAGSVNNMGMITFNMPSGIFMVSGSKTVTVRADVASGTSGQSIGFNLTSYTVMGGTAASTNVAGVTLPIANVSLAGVTLNSQTSVTNTNLNIPQTNYTVWGTSASVATRAVTLKGLTLKMIGSAPVNSVTNVQLFVDGVSVGSASADMNQRFTFAPNKFLGTGGHTIEVRADIVSGANRNFYFTLENVADMMAEDTQVAGANVAIAGYATYKQGATQTISSVGSSSVTLATDPAFVATSLVTGATNQTIAKYKLTAYGEDTKIQYLSVTPTLSAGASNGTVTNVSLYVNGAQIGSNYTVTNGAAQQFSLGSNFIAMAGTAYTVEVKADLVNATGTNNTGTISAAISAISGQGMSSQNTFGPVSPSATTKTLTIGGGTPSIGNTVGAVNSTVSANSAVKIASFSIQGGSVEAINLRTLVLGLTGTGALTSLNLVSNITLTDETGATVGTPTGIASASQTYNVSVPVAIGQTKTINVMATIGAATNGDTLIPTLTVGYTGASSNQSTTASAVTGSTITIGNIAVNTPTVSSKVAGQYVLGNTNKQVIVYNMTSTNGSATLNDATFSVTGNGVQSLTINGKTANVVGSAATFYGLDLAIQSGNNGVNVPVTVNFTPAYVGSGTGVVSGTTNAITLTGTKTTDASGNVVSTTTLALAANTMTLVASLPTVTAGGNGTSLGVNGASVSGVKIGSITVKADTAGDIVVGKLSYNLNTPAAASNIVVKVGGSTALDKNSVAPTNTTTSSTFTNGYRITAGTTVTFDIFADVAAVTTAGTTSAALGANGNFLWSDDVTTAGTGLNGTLLSSTNYNN